MQQATNIEPIVQRAPVLGSDNRFPRFVLGGTHIRTLPPAADGRVHSAFVAFPYAYEKNPQRQFPVLYLCDGFWDFLMTVGFYGNLIWEKAAPEFFIVGLSYGGNSEHPRNDDYRHCDYLPFPAPDRKNAPKETDWTSTQYLDYLQTKLMPFIESEYNIDSSYRVLAGCSIGALFALTAMFSTKDVFRGYIALNPPLSFGNGWLFQLECSFYKQSQSTLARALLKAPKLPARLFLSSAELDHADIKTQIADFYQLMVKRRYRGLELQHCCIQGEGHGASKAAGYCRGIRFAFNGYADATM